MLITFVLEFGRWLNSTAVEMPVKEIIFMYLGINCVKIKFEVVGFAQDCSDSIFEKKKKLI